MNFIKERYDLNGYIVLSIAVKKYPGRFQFDIKINKVCEVIIELVDIDIREKLIIQCHKVDFMKYNYNDVIFLGLRQLQEAAIIEKDGNRFQSNLWY